MHKQLINEATIECLITTKGPILVKSGLEGGVDPTIPDMNFVRTIHPGTGEITIYLPGSSLKGTMRSYCEKIIRTLDGEKSVCDLFDESCCAKRLENNKKLSSPEVYKSLCPACQLFGSGAFASHITFLDAYPEANPELKLQKRTNVAIDRILGSVAQGPFDIEVLSQGAFKMEIQLRNFELWQLGLLALALRDLEKEHIRIGFAKSRGLGHVKGDVKSVSISYLGYQWEGADKMVSRNGTQTEKCLNNVSENEKTGAKVYGVGALLGEAGTAYEYSTEDAVILEKVRIEPPEDAEEDYLRAVQSFRQKTDITALFKACVSERWSKRPKCQEP